MGVLQEPVTKSNWWEKTDDTVLFAHNIQYQEVHNMDIYENQAGRGVGGRMADTMTRKGFSSNAVSLAGVADALASTVAPNLIVDPWAGVQKLNPMEWAQPLWDQIKRLNPMSKIGSNLFGETWSNVLMKSVGDGDFLKDTIDATSVTTSFPDTYVSDQFELLSKLIKSQDSRG